MLLRRAAWIVSLLVGVCFPSVSQFHTRSVTGIVTDKRGNALAGAAVQIENSANLSVRSFITGNDGRYHFDQLRDDIDFTLKAKYRQFWSEPKTLSKFDGSARPEIDLKIPID